jgi:hypothetical protein
VKTGHSHRVTPRLYPLRFSSFQRSARERLPRRSASSDSNHGLARRASANVQNGRLHPEPGNEGPRELNNEKNVHISLPRSAWERHQRRSASSCSDHALAHRADAARPGRTSPRRARKRATSIGLKPLAMPTRPPSSASNLTASSTRVQNIRAPQCCSFPPGTHARPLRMNIRGLSRICELFRPESQFDVSNPTGYSGQTKGCGDGEVLIRLIDSWTTLNRDPSPTSP